MLATILTRADAPARRVRKRERRGNHDRRDTDSRRKPDPVASPPRDDGSSADLDTEERALLKLLNDYRAASGLSPLIHNRKLGVAAEIHARDMAVNNFTGHIGSDRSTADQRIEAAGYHYEWSGENVFWGSGSAKSAFAWWKSSPDHNDNLLFGKFTETGIRRAYNPASRYGWYWTNTFGSPRAPKSAR